jgi:cell division protease FtsH
LIDEEVRRIVMEGEKKAWEVLGANVDKLNAVADALMEYETISGEETMLVMNGGKIERKEDDEDAGPIGSAVPSAGIVRPPRGEPDTGGMEPQPT